MLHGSGRPTVVVVGGGAAGSLVALHLARTSHQRGSAVDVVVVDPADTLARGTAFGTTDDEHLLNVPASGMTALPADPGHFVAWRARQDHGSPTEATAFAPRRQFGRYLEQVVRESFELAGATASLRHVRTRATGLRRSGAALTVQLADGHELPADGVVVATGLPAAGHDWAVDELLASPFFVPDPWAPGALDVVRRDRRGPADVLVVGAGLTMVDVVLSLTRGGTRDDRRVVAVSRTGELPAVHAEEQQLAAIPDVDDWGGTLDELRRHVERYVGRVSGSTGDWRPAMDGLRFRVSELWQRLSEADRAAFLAHDAGRWNRHRHRMPPSSAAVLRGLADAGRLEQRTGRVTDAEPLPTGGLRVTLDDGSSVEAGWVVNCTGPALDVTRLADPLLDDLLTPRGGVALARTATAGMGLRTRDARLLDSTGRADAPVWTLGALRRGELWESTAVPEIRSQAVAVAVAVLDAVAPQPRRLEDGRLVSGQHPVARPRDPLGLPLSTTAEAATRYNAGLERVMRLQSGGEELLREAAALDPDFALAHAALAMLGHEAGADTDVDASLQAARRAVLRRGDDRERSLVDVVGRRVDDTRHEGARALMNHIARHPRDVLAVSAAVPTIAFSGVTDIQQEAWDLVDGLAPAYGDHWWYISLLAFTRQDQGRFEEAGLLAESALFCEPSSGHAVHAQTHVLYETGRHEAGRVWLDHWVAESGREASHRAHFSWHAALHELATGDTEAVRRRYYSQLAPPTVTGVRALVDSASLLWRWRITTSDWDAATGGSAFVGESAPPPVQSVLDAAGPGLVDRPETPFVALHSALALAAAGDLGRLAALRRHCASASDPTVRTVVATVCDGLLAAGEGDWDTAALVLGDLQPQLVRVGGSAAQREVVEETLLFALVSSGRAEAAARLLDARLDRRPSPLDARRRGSLLGAAASGR
ncbi:putative NAD(P)/FAD-binding protein YdhS [Terracoccus luteus]|uniref:Putative NAD(P)/FAD-binding protein YdhS n=1 Tax=Terracoccus luteus TaxID=53356 RepID=A0A495XWP4_9MICO|nr:FAD/NAD(P)-binding protein [Terracoccus luteus]RKT78392.1 putative NAD(P)/FAD-binding protein YdhS [Terracoccus luteus]